MGLERKGFFMPFVREQSGGTVEYDSILLNVTQAEYRNFIILSSSNVSSAEVQITLLSGSNPTIGFYVYRDKAPYQVLATALGLTYDTTADETYLDTSKHTISMSSSTTILIQPICHQSGVNTLGRIKVKY